jgi:hypothetical protein
MVAAQTAGIPRIMSVVSESFSGHRRPAGSGLIKSVETGSLGSNPERPSAIFEYGADDIASQAAGIVWIMGEMSKRSRFFFQPV